MEFHLNFLKRKSIVKEQKQDNSGKFAKKSRVDDNWEDENDSGWDEIYLPNEDENKSNKRNADLTDNSFTRAAKG